MEKINQKAILGLGSNLGDRLKNLQTSCRHIEENLGQIISTSNVYETKPWGFESENNFLNACVMLKTKLSPVELLYGIQLIEKGLGRIRSQGKHYVSRPIDIDILFFENTEIVTKDLQIPHPLYHERLFVLYPLMDLNETFFSKPTYETISELIDQCMEEERPSVFAENWFHSFNGN